MATLEAEMESIVFFLRDKPEYAEILRRARDLEDEHAGDESWLGWQWFQVRANPGQITKLVTMGLVTVTLSTKSSTHYRLTDPSLVEIALAELGTPQTRGLEGFGEVEGVEKVEIPDDLFDVVVGYDDVKRMMLTALKAEKPVHFLLWGAPGTAKSLMLDCLRRLPNSVLVLGSAATKAGLRDVIMDNPSGEVLLLIDEVEKVDNPRDLDVLLRAMETGEVVKTIHGSHREERKRLKVVATANNVKRLSPELKSRFLPVRFRPYSEEEFYEVGRRVLTMKEGAPKEIAEYITRRVLGKLRSRDVRDCIKVWRLVEADPTREAVDQTIRTMSSVR